MDPTLIAVLGMLIGLALLIIEFFVPSGGMIFIFACICLVVGVWGAWKAWSDDSMWAFYTYLGSLFVLAPSSVAGGLYLLNNTSFGDRILLTAPSPEDVAGFSDEVEKLQELVGQRGKTLGLLNPGGMVTVDESRYHCESQGMMIDPNTEVEVVEVDGTRLVVRVPIGPQNSQDIEEDEKVSEPEVETAGTESEGIAPFDFDIPEEAS